VDWVTPRHTGTPEQGPRARQARPNARPLMPQPAVPPWVVDSLSTIAKAQRGTRVAWADCCTTWQTGHHMFSARCCFISQVPGTALEHDGAAAGVSHAASGQVLMLQSIKVSQKKVTQSYSCARVSQGLDACRASAKQLGDCVRSGAKTCMKREPPSTASPSKKIPCAPHHAGALMVQPSGCTLCAAHPFTWHLYGTSSVVPCPHKRPGHRSFRRAKQATAAAPV